jgi:hypothetical protein
MYKASAVIGTLVLSTALVYSGDAHAAFVRQHGSACFSINDSSNPWQDSSYSLYNGNSGSGGNAELMCAAPDTDVNAKYSWTVVNVELSSGSQYGTAAAICQDYWNDGGGSCAPSRIMPGSWYGHYSLQLGGDVSSVWTPSSEANFGYVYINNGSGDLLKGLYYAR